VTQKKLNIFMTAYDVNPFSGSEAGMGWNFAFHIAKHHNVFLVTRKNNRENIELWIKQNIKNYKSVVLKISYFDLPDWVLWIKGGPKLWVLYYYFWQLFLAIKYRRNILKCDLSHALNFHSDIFPSFLWMYSKFFFWGPINHHEKIPRDQLPNSGGFQRLYKKPYNLVYKTYKLEVQYNSINLSKKIKCCFCWKFSSKGALV